eukprot:CAMPEP_0198616062 /NCGR_PEP_ID=MMETSP1462-20131121/159706_1 /TAXON_ID=1333877 /ORGANISM="Brandtodinium nutriculum, Strain RCC3387" /LENGTH=248 /DNA_ID=CAMNT_0044347863 /DNA_START=140 /DNA_END=883 /DNA_ORIENTATION=+
MQGLWWLKGFACLSPDQRGFAISFGALVGFLPRASLVAVGYMLGSTGPGLCADAMAAITVMPLVLASLWLGLDGFTKVPCIGPFLVRAVMRPLRNERLAHVRATSLRGLTKMGDNIAIDAATLSSTSSSEASEPEDGDLLQPEMGGSATVVATTSSALSAEASDHDDGGPLEHECHNDPGAVPPGDRVTPTCTKLPMPWFKGGVGLLARPKAPKCARFSHWRVMPMEIPHEQGAVETFMCLKASARGA